MFTLTCEKGKRLINATLSGLMTLSEAKDYAEQRKRIAVANGWAPGTYSVLVNFGDLIQTREVSDVLASLHRTEATRPDRIAIIASPDHSSRLQARRMLTGSANGRVVATVDEAYAYLCGDRLSVSPHASPSIHSPPHPALR